MPPGAAPTSPNDPSAPHGRRPTGLTTPPVCPTPGTTPGIPDDDPTRRGKGYPVGDPGTHEGYRQADDPTWQAGPGSPAQGGHADAACQADTRLAAGRAMEDGVVVGRPPWGWLTLWTLLGLGVAALRRRRDAGDTAPADAPREN